MALPNDNCFEQTVNHGSGKKLANATLMTFSPSLKNVVTGEKIEKLDRALKTAGDGNYTYLTYPEILYWEDRATEWSGRQDRLMVKVTLANVATGETLDSAILKGTSKWGTNMGRFTFIQGVLRINKAFISDPLYLTVYSKVQISLHLPISEYAFTIT